MARSKTFNILAALGLASAIAITAAPSFAREVYVWRDDSYYTMWAGTTLSDCEAVEVDSCTRNFECDGSTIYLSAYTYNTIVQDLSNGHYYVFSLDGPTGYQICTLSPR